MSPIRLAALALLAAASAGGCQRDDGGTPLVVVIGDARPALGDLVEPSAGTPQGVLRQATAQGLVRYDAGGQIEPGLAERWNVSDDGLSYIFRLASGEWPDGRKIMARDVARMVERQLRADGDSAVRDAAGSVEEVVAMTDRVVEIRLSAPRPNLLPLLAHPDFALIREGSGSGPFQPVDAARTSSDPDSLHLARRLPDFDGERGEREEVRLAVMPAPAAIAAFAGDKARIVLGGTFVDLPLAQRARQARGTLQFDPVAGLFGLVPVRAAGPLAKPEVRRLLSEAIDRPALLAALGVPGLQPRATLLEAGLYGLAAPAQPAWLGQPLAPRQPALTAALRRALDLAADAPLPTLAIALPDGPGSDLLFARLKADWGALGLGLERAGKGARADLTLVDQVAPSDSPAWFLRRFRCEVAAPCDAEADALLAAARTALPPAQRAALLGQAAALMDKAALFIPLTAPIRWSLVDRQLPGFVPNRLGRHPLSSLTDRPGASR